MIDSEITISVHHKRIYELLRVSTVKGPSCCCGNGSQNEGAMGLMTLLNRLSDEP